MRDRCPRCNSKNYKKNGHIHNGKQNYQCKDCGREFVLNPENKIVSEEQKALIKKLLLERISLRGICRVVGISLKWLLDFIEELYDSLPAHLNLHTVKESSEVIIKQLEAEADEMWSFVGKKENKKWIWLAIDAKTGQVMAFHVGDRSKESAKALWRMIPKEYRKHATFYTDLYEAYKDIIPKKQHRAASSKSGKTNHIERFNCTLRQRVSRLVRKTLSFSKKLKNHIGAIKYFICHYNLKKAKALHV